MRRHLLDGSGDGPGAVVDALFALHATDPATVYLSVLARSHGTSLADVSAAMYRRRTLVRLMAMRRTLFVFRTDDAPAVQAAVSDPLAATLERALVARLDRNGTDPALGEYTLDWLRSTGARVEDALRARGAATGSELSADVPALRTRIHARSASERPQTVTTSLLTQMSAQGRIVRGDPVGAWTNRVHRWEPAEAWWPGGLRRPPVEEARAEVVRRYLGRFGPARFEDLQWWTGWAQGTVRSTLADLDVEAVDLHGDPGLALAGDEDPVSEATAGPATRRPSDPPPVAALLPALDPTPMGWKHRDWFTGVDRGELYDRAGNIGPTIWWDGEIVGSWATLASGELRTAVLVDRGEEATRQVARAAEMLQTRLGGAAVTPSARTPREKKLATEPHAGTDRG